MITKEILIERIGEQDFEFLFSLPYEKAGENLARLRTISNPLCKCLYLYSLAERARDVTFSMGQVSRSRLFPKRVIQFWDSQVPPKDVDATMASWKNLPDYEYVQYNEESAHQFMKEHYGKEIVQLYEHCHHAAMKSDVFRLACLLKVGGIYIDADDERIGGLIEDDLAYDREVGVAPLFWSIEHQHNFHPDRHLAKIVLGNGVFTYVNNAPLLAAANNKFIETVFNVVLRNIHLARSSDRRVNIHEETGPGTLSAVFAMHVAKNGFGSTAADAIGLMCNWSWAARTRWHNYKSGPSHWSNA